MASASIPLARLSFAKTSYSSSDALFQPVFVEHALARRLLLTESSATRVGMSPMVARLSMAKCSTNFTMVTFKPKRGPMQSHSCPPKFLELRRTDATLAREQLLPRGCRSLFEYCASSLLEGRHLSIPS